MKRHVFILLSLLVFAPVIFAQYTNWSSLKPGKYKVGFKTILEKDRDQKPVLFSLWYPASSGGRQMSLADLLKAKKSLGESDTSLINGFKSNILRLYDLKTIDEAAFQNSISQMTNSFENPSMANGRFPLIIAFADPSSYFVSFEFLASHGFIIATATAHFDEPPPPPHHYEPFVNLLEDLFSYVYRQPFVDTSNISAFGHGGGIQSAMYLAMRNQSIKRVINLDGGFFGPRSRTDLAAEYHPEQFEIPLLHIVTQSQAKQDDANQFHAIKSSIVRVTIKSDSIWHHDFTAFGIMGTYGIRVRTPLILIDKVIRSVNEIMLEFLMGKGVRAKSNEYFKIENFN